MKRMPLAQLLVLASLTLAFVGTVGGASLTFGGVAFSPGSTVKANVPLSAQEKSLAAQGGNVVPPNVVAGLATPSNFDPRTSWPVLVICSNSYFKRQHRDYLADFYRRVGVAKGWLLLVGCGPQYTQR